MSLLPVSVPLLGGEELEVGDNIGISSSFFLVAVFRFMGTSMSLQLLLVTILLLLLFFLAFNAGDNCSELVGGDGGEFAQADANSPGWKKAGFGGNPRDVAAIN